MEYLTAEQIAEQAEQAKTDRTARGICNRLFKLQDESRLFPIRGRFNATSRAIRRVNQIERANGSMAPLEYCLSVESEISQIVNNPNI